MELLAELKSLPPPKRINKLASLYFKKCWQGVLFANGKFNGGVWNYVIKQIKEYYTEQDVIITYEYLLDIDYENMTIYNAMKFARDKIAKEKSIIQEEKVKTLEAESYSDYLEDIMKCL